MRLKFKKIIYENLLIYKVDIALRVGNRKHCLQFSLYGRNPWVLSCPRRLSVRPSLLTVTGTFPLPESQFVFSARSVFSTQACYGKLLLIPFENIFIKTCFSVHIRDFSVNFLWFVIHSHLEFEDRPVLAWNTVFDFPTFWIALKQIFLWD